MINEPFVIERKYNAPISKVWKALTDKNEMKEWYFKLSDFKPEVGFEFEFTASNAGKTYLHKCKVTEVIHEKKLSHSWRYEGEPGNSFVTWELFAKGNDTLVKLTHAGLETFPQNKPDYLKENFAQGWTMIVGKNLKNYVEKQPG